jgi:hypothetical protein
MVVQFHPMSFYAPLAQSVEHKTLNLGVAGSIPAGGSRESFPNTSSISTVGSATDCYIHFMLLSVGRRFDPDIELKIVRVAQVVERTSEVRAAPSSNLGPDTFKKSETKPSSKMAGVLKGAGGADPKDGSISLIVLLV